MRRFRLHYVVWVGVLCFLAGVLTACNTVQKNVPEPYKGGPQPWADQPLTASAVTVREGVNYLSDLTWESATNGWGSVERDRSNGEAASGDGRTLTLNGQTFSKGLGAHAASRIVYDLGGQCRSFKASVGMDDEVGSRGSVVFQVFADGNQLYDSGTMTGDTATKTLDINITGKTRLELVVTIAGDNNYYDHANWADARLECSPSTVTSLAGTYQIVAQHSSKCLDVSGVSQRNGTNIQQFTCYTVNNQIWDVKPFGELIETFENLSILRKNG